MQQFILSTDSCCDVFKADLKRQNVRFAPLAYIHNGEEHRDTYSDEKDYRAFYDFIRKGNLPTTTQLNLFETEEYFEQLLTEGEGDVVHITLSSGLSGTYNNAVAASKEAMAKFPGRKVYVVDSLGATVGQMMLVDIGVRDRLEGLSALETYEHLSHVSRHTHYIIMANDLFHLKRGGRVSAASAIVGTILQIKPLIVFNRQGQLVVVDKAKGITKAMRNMVKIMQKNAVDLDKNALYIAHADSYEIACDLKEMVQEECAADVKIGWIGPIIGTHTGPGTIGLVWISDEERPDVKKK